MADDRSSLPDEPAVPESMEPAAVSDEEPLTLAQLRDAWDAQADAANCWDALGIDEIVCWAQKQALARWGQQAQPQPAAIPPPTRRQLMMLASDMGMASIDEAVMKFALAALALWGIRQGILDSSITPPPEAVEPTEEELEQAYESAYQPAWEQGDSHDAHLKGLRAVFALAAPPALPPNYIDPEHQGDDRELLQTFYRACRADGGTADEIHLRGIRAVLAARSATPPAPAEGEVADPPPELVHRWVVEGQHYTYETPLSTYIATQAARWGAAHALPLPSGEVEG